MILVAPPTGMLDREQLLAFPGEVLIVAGQHDEWVDRRVLSEWVQEAPRARLEVIPDCDHFFMTGLAPLARAIADWWKELAAS